MVTSISQKFIIIELLRLLLTLIGLDFFCVKQAGKDLLMHLKHQSKYWCNNLGSCSKLITDPNQSCNSSAESRPTHMWCNIGYDNIKPLSHKFKNNNKVKYLSYYKSKKK
ncbi:hypothetical protein ACTFIV_002633 [Dictyostelium citrinum]